VPQPGRRLQVLGLVQRHAIAWRRAWSTTRRPPALRDPAVPQPSLPSRGSGDAELRADEISGPDRDRPVEVVGVGELDGVKGVRADEHNLHRGTAVQLLLGFGVGGHGGPAVRAELSEPDQLALLVIEHEEKVLNLPGRLLVRYGTAARRSSPILVSRSAGTTAPASSMAMASEMAASRSSTSLGPRPPFRSSSSRPPGRSTVTAHSCITTVRSWTSIVRSTLSRSG